MNAETAAFQVQVVIKFQLLTRILFNFYEFTRQERLRALQGLIHDIDNERRRNEQNLNSIFRTQEKLLFDDRSPVLQQKIRTLYKIGLHDASQEENLLRQALAKIQEIRAIRNERRIYARNSGNKETIRRGALMKMLEISAMTLPLFVSKIGETRIPPLCGCIPADSSYVAKPGDMVAALVKGLEEDENWILAEVVSFLPIQNKYEVDDIDEEQKDRHILSKCRVIPLPLMRANPETDASALFPKGTMVNALYPQTTCFYKAIINQLPQAATDEYELVGIDAKYFTIFLWSNS